MNIQTNLQVLRRGLGDLFVGLLYTMEATVPFSSLRSGLRTQPHLKDSIVDLINCIILTIVYCIVRVMVFPSLYLLHAHQNQLSFIEAITTLPWHCHAGTLAILTFQTYWFGRIVQTAKKTFYSYCIRKGHERSSQRIHKSNKEDWCHTALLIVSSFTLLSDLWMDERSKKHLFQFQIDKKPYKSHLNSNKALSFRDKKDFS